MKRQIRLIMLLVLYAVCTAGTQAAVLFQGDAEGSFSNPLDGAEDYTKIWNYDVGPSYWYASTFEWGTVGSKAICANARCRNIPLPQTGSSQLAFDGAGSDAGETGYKVGLGTPFSLGVFKYINMPTYFSEGVAGVDFTVDVSFANLNTSKPFTYHALIENTWNAPNNAPDTVALSGTPVPFMFTSGGQAYRFSMLGFSRNGGASFDTSFTVNEGQSIKAGLYGRFDLATTSPASVPVPSALWLFGSGLLTTLAQCFLIGTGERAF